MTKEELAALLNGRGYMNEITRAEEAQARAAGLIVAFGASDDLLEVRGAASEELGAYNGGVFPFRAVNSSFEAIEERDNERDLIKAGWTPPPVAVTIKAAWAPADEAVSWLITSDKPFAAFKIMEGDDVFCIGAVIDPSPHLAGGGGA